MTAIGDAVAIITGATEQPNYEKFKQNKQFFYLCGVEVPRAMLLIDGRSKTSTLFLPARTPANDSSEGPLLAPGDEAKRLTGIEAVSLGSDFDGAVRTPFDTSDLAVLTEALIEEGVFASVINVTSADHLFSKWHASDVRTVREARHQPNPFPALLSDEEVGIPAVLVADGHPHNLAFIGTALKVRAISLGVSGFGESGTVADLFRKHDLHPDSIVNAAIAVTDARAATGQLS